MVTVPLLARLSFWIPWLALALLGLAEHALGGLRAAPSGLFVPALIVLLIGAGLGAAALLRARDDQAGRREALLGLGSGALGVLVVVLALVTGARERGLRADHELRQRALGRRAAGESGGWMGRAQGPGFAVFITEIDPNSEAARAFLGNFPRPFQILMVAVDNRGGAAPLTLDLAAAQALRGDGAPRPGLPRGELLATATAGRAELLQQHGSPYPIPPGGRLGNAMIFLDPAEDLRQVAAVVVQVNGQPLRVPGRHVSAEEKRAMRRPPR